MNRRNLLIAATTLAIGKFTTPDTALAAVSTAPLPSTTEGASGLPGIPEGTDHELRWRTPDGVAMSEWIDPVLWLVAMNIPWDYAPPVPAL